VKFNPLNAELNPICHLLALLGAHPILHVSRIRVNFLYAVTATRWKFKFLGRERHLYSDGICRMLVWCHFLFEMPKTL